MITFGIDSNNDIYLTPQGNVVLKYDLDAMGDIFINKSQVNKGELLYSDSGIDFFNNIFGEPAYTDIFQYELISELQNTAKTQNISGYTQEINGDVYSYTVNCQTSYGQITLQG